jgi:4-hydroxy-L-threonine phosphate dehydrogenase PdxA
MVVSKLAGEKIEEVGNVMNNKPIIGITMGDAAGIGPEVLIKALANEEVYNVCRPLVIGDIKVLEFVKEKINLSLKL